MQSLQLWNFPIVKYVFLPSLDEKDWRKHYSHSIFLLEDEIHIY